MRDPLSWSLSLGRLFGVTIRLHILFIVLALGLVLHEAFHAPAKADAPAPYGTTLDAIILVGILLGSVLIHELGHCIGAWLVDGDAEEVVLWPLGGLAALEIPPRPRAHFTAAVAGPIANLLAGALAGLLLVWASGFEAHPPWNPFWYPYREEVNQAVRLARLYRWDGQELAATSWGAALLARTFWVNWILFLLNLLPGFPLDGGRILQSLLWSKYGFRQATLYAISVGFFTMIAVAISALAFNHLLPLFLAWFIYVTCRNQWIVLETGGEDSGFGYDFSQGYTSLESAPAPPRRRRPGLWQRWLQRRASRRLQRELDQRESEDRRMDELLEKVQREGLTALTEEERRFLKRVSDRYRNRQ